MEYISLCSKKEILNTLQHVLADDQIRRILALLYDGEEIENQQPARL